MAKSTNRPWLATPVGIWFTAIGLCAVMFCLVLFGAGDAFTLSDGKAMRWGIRDSLYLPLAAIAAIFSAFSFFVWRPWMPKILIALFALAMASHIVERVVELPPQSLRIAAALRILISLALAAVFLWQRFTERSGASIN
jgi:hypothetical protein